MYSLGGGSPGPQLRGKLRGIWSRPTAKGEVEGDLSGGWCLLQGEGVCSGGCLLQGVPAMAGCLLGGGVETPLPCDGYCCGRYASYWNAFLFDIFSH